MTVKATRGRGHVLKDAGVPVMPAQMAAWESLVVEAVGNTIDFWRFKRNHGRAWALLFLRGQPLSQADLQRSLGLSKGAASMVTGELERWGVIQKVRVAGDATWRYVAQTDLMRMIRRVLQERELTFVERVKSDLDEAHDLAKATGDVPHEIMQRLNRMRMLASLVDKALRAFVLTAKLDVAAAVAVLSDPLGRK